MFKNFPFYQSIILATLSASIGFLIAWYCLKSLKDKDVSDSQNKIECFPTIKRLDGYKHIRPLMFVDNTCEAERLMPLKSAIGNVLDTCILKNELITASVYFKDLSNNDYFCYNEGEKYSPGSLLKVPILIAFLKMRENNPTLFEKRILYDVKLPKTVYPTILDKSIVFGNSYSISELLTYMIRYSDNNATILLNTIMDRKVYEKLFDDFGISKPELGNPYYEIGPREYSLFLRSLYNASYLSIKDSEYATELLTLTRFKNGISAGLPSNIEIAHKFGESGNQFVRHLNEGGIVYLNDKSYVLIIMTKGKDINKLTNTISKISKSVYSYEIGSVQSN